MELKKVAGNMKKLVMSRDEWKAIGKRAGWDDIWHGRGDRLDKLDLEEDEDEVDPEEDAYKMLFPNGDAPAVEEGEFAEDAGELEQGDLRAAAEQARAELSEILEAQMERGIPAPASVLAEDIVQVAQDYLDLKGVDISATMSNIEILSEFLNADTADPNEAIIKGIIKRILATAEERGASSRVSIKIASTRVSLTRDDWISIGRRAGWSGRA